MKTTKFVSVAIGSRGDTYTIIDPSKIVAIQWEEHDDRMPHVLFMEGGHVFRVTTEEMETLRDKAISVGVDMGWINGVVDSTSD